MGEAVTKGGSVMRYSCDSPMRRSKMSVDPRGEPWIGSGDPEKELVTPLALPWLMPRLRAMLGTSTPCPVLFLSCPAVLPPSLLDGGPGVPAWPLAGVLLGCLGLGDEVRVSRPKAVISRLTVGGVAFVVTDSPPPVGVTMSPARYMQS